MVTPSFFVGNIIPHLDTESHSSIPIMRFTKGQKPPKLPYHTHFGSQKSTFKNFQSKITSRKKFSSWPYIVCVKVSSKSHGSFSRSSFSGPVFIAEKANHTRAPWGPYPARKILNWGVPPAPRQLPRSSRTWMVFGAGRRKPCYRKATDYGALYWQGKM